MSVAVILSGGGERLVAWQTGVLAGLAEAGWDPRQAELVVGTSAGALVAERLAAGIDPRADARELERRVAPPAIAGGDAFAALEAAWESLGASDAERWRAVARLALEHSPGGEEAFVAELRRRVSGSPWPEALELATIDPHTGERVLLHRHLKVEPARGVAASRAIPIGRPPVHVRGRALIDGALGSGTNADVAARRGIERVLVVTGIPADPVPGSVEAIWARALEREIDGLGIPAHVVRPDPDEWAALGAERMRPAPQAVAPGRARGRALAAQMRPRLAA